MPDRSRFDCAVVLIVSFTSFRFAQEPAVWRDPSPHRLQFVSVEPNVRLEVLDWGGSGRPLILLKWARQRRSRLRRFRAEAFGHRPCIRHNSAWMLPTRGIVRSS